ncbi:unnamed protein product, partial [marine sediment metagenome]
AIWVKAMKGPAVRLYESGLFDRALGDMIRPGGLKLTARVAEVARLDKTSNVLEIGCGKGTTACFLARRYTCNVVGIDLSDKMIALAKREAEAEKLVRKVKFLVADGKCLPFLDSAFDAVVCECSFSLLPDKEKAAREIKRVLRSAGTQVISSTF